MASSDDEEETQLEVVTNYYFEDSEDYEPVSFAGLPLHWDGESGRLDGIKDSVYMGGFTDNGLRKIYMEIKGWKMDLSNANPEIWVLSKDNSWLKLQKPRKSFEGTIRTVLITVNCLHYLKRNPNASAKSLWDHLNKAFSLYDAGPSAQDLADHVTLINRAMKMDRGLSNCKFLISLLEDKPWKKKIPFLESVVKPAFVVEDTEDHTMDDIEDDSDEDEEEEKGVCAFCDNGGNMTCCDGKCLRKFHANKADADEDTICQTLGLSKAQLEAMPSFVCKNCRYKQHQCFICGKLGSSDKYSGAEVFQCIMATCGHFYHPHCVAKWLHPKDEVVRKELQEKIAEGEPFTCPIHNCRVCNQRENKDIEDLQFAVCQRCPTAYHRKCLPREILFEETDDMPVRAWENLLPDNHILIYCLKHEIDEQLKTPARGHIIFPPAGESRSAVGEKRKGSLESLSSKGEVSKKRHLSKSGSLGSNAVKKSTDKAEKSAVAAKEIGKGETVRSSFGNDMVRKVSQIDTSKKSQKNPQKSGSLKAGSSSKAKERSQTLGKRLFDYMEERSGQVKPGKRSDFESESSKIDIDVEKLRTVPALDADSERRLLQLIKDAEYSVSMDDVKRKQNVPSTHTLRLKSFVEKNITCGKVEGAIEAIRSAVKKIEGGSSVEDAQAVCEPKVLAELFKWKDKLKVYLAPFLFGMRYTSFGRHFTKAGKLREIVDKLHWYIKDGDMIVDFCCGANDFSCLMADKLKETGKKCTFKNYDCLQAKNDFHFERRDWMTVERNELPKGSKLVMGLNPPFGVKAALANKFINKALEFKPKLIILIVPPETERLDKKKYPYDLVWEDDHFLSGKSFYLPGSIDANDKQMEDWNVTPPLLNLWSRKDFTAEHRLIAEKQGHLCKQEESLHLDQPVDNHSNGDAPSSLTEGILARSERAEIKDNPALTEGCVSRNNSGKGNQEGLGYLGNQPNGTYRKGERVKEKHVNAKASTAEISREDRSPGDEMLRETPVRCSPSITDKKSSFTNCSLRSHDMPLDVGPGNGDNQHNDPSASEPRSEFDAIYGEINPDEIDRRYSLNNGNYYSHQRYADGGIAGSYYGPRDLDRPDRYYTGHMRENLDNPGYDGIDNYLRDYDRQGQAHSYRQPGSGFSQRPYLSAHHPGYDHMGSASSTYGLRGPASAPSYNMNTSALQRYPLPLDEMSPPRVNILGSDPRMYGRNRFSDPGLSQPAQRGASEPGSQDASMGFAPGPMHFYTRRNSSGGWLYE